MAAEKNEKRDADTKAAESDVAASTPAAATESAAPTQNKARQVQPKPVTQRGAMMPVAKTNINTGSKMIVPGEKIVDADILSQLTESVHYEMRFLPDAD